jgi:hypothetical protein
MLGDRGVGDEATLVPTGTSGNRGNGLRQPSARAGFGCGKHQALLGKRDTGLSGQVLKRKIIHSVGSSGKSVLSISQVEDAHNAIQKTTNRLCSTAPQVP